MSVMAGIIDRVFEEIRPQDHRRPAPGLAAFTPEIDIDRVLDRIAARRRARLNWRASIVDLLKLLDLDHGFSARKTLALELGYAHCLDDGVAMNGWLHRQVMRRLADSSPRALSAYLH
jgi:hypothetical protein